MTDNVDKTKKEDAPNSKNTKPESSKENKAKDYWDRVADDVASGYRSKEDENNILNIDQEPGDHEPGDKDPA